MVCTSGGSTTSSRGPTGLALVEPDLPQLELVEEQLEALGVDRLGCPRSIVVAAEDQDLILLDVD